MHGRKEKVFLFVFLMYKENCKEKFVICLYSCLVAMQQTVGLLLEKLNRYTWSVYYISQQLVNSINSQYKNNKIHREIVEKFKSFCRYEL